jgi:predicted amidophosphoribosyltransferase
MAKCTVCGAKAGFMSSMCDSCLQAAVERQAKAAEQKVHAASPLTDRELLEHIAELMKHQQEGLAIIRWRTGCLFAWLLLSIILGIMGVLKNGN